MHRASSLFVWQEIKSCIFLTQKTDIHRASSFFVLQKEITPCVLLLHWFGFVVQRETIPSTIPCTNLVPFLPGTEGNYTVRLVAFFASLLLRRGRLHRRGRYEEASWVRQACGREGEVRGAVAERLHAR